MSLFEGNCIILKPLEGGPSDTFELQVNLKNESVNKFNAETLKELAQALDKIPSSIKGLLAKKPLSPVPISPNF
jgi:hypothetical protein